MYIILERMLGSVEMKSENYNTKTSSFDEEVINTKSSFITFANSFAKISEFPPTRGVEEITITFFMSIS